MLFKKAYVQAWRLKGFSFCCSFLLLLEYPQPHVWIEGMNGLPPAAKKVYIFNQSTKNLLEGQLDSIISRAVEHIMMLGFYKHKSYTHLTTTIRWCSAKTKLRKRMCRAGENRLKRNFLVEKPVAIHTSLLKLWPGVVLISWLLSSSQQLLNAKVYDCGCDVFS